MLKCCVRLRCSSVKSYLEKTILMRLCISNLNKAPRVFLRNHSSTSSVAGWFSVVHAWNNSTSLYSSLVLVFSKILLGSLYRHSVVNNL